VDGFLGDVQVTLRIRGTRESWPNPKTRPRRPSQMGACERL
jgi:hypothetical protein